MVICSVLGCKNRSERNEENVSFHRFPLKSDVVKKWISSTGRVNWQPNNYSRICSLHFVSSCFRKTKKRMYLKPQSIPTLHIKGTQVLILDDQPSTSTQAMPADIVNENLEDTINLTGHESMDIAMEVEVHSCPEAIPDNVVIEPTTPLVTPRKRKLIKQLKSKSNVAQNRKRKLAAIRSKTWRLEKKSAEQSVVIQVLRAKCLINQETADILTSINLENKEFISRFLGNTNKRKFSPALRKFALTLHFISPRAYRFVRKQFNTCLPHPRTLSRWYETVEGNPGFSKESLKAVKQLSELQSLKNPSQKLFCALCFDEMAIRKHIDFDGNNCIGFVDHGNSVESDQPAKEALVFMLTSINGSWKIPLGYFLINGISADQKANLLKTCLELVNECGVKVISVTFDGCPTNFAMAKILGCSIEANNINPSFLVGDQKIVIFPDPAHMLKLVRNTMGEKQILIDDMGRVISWRFVKYLVDLQENEGLHLATKIKEQHINFKKQIMKVKLAAQVMSQSVADAIDFCTNDLKIEYFQQSGATVDFITNVNNLFDVMNSRNLNSYGFKKPISEVNATNIMDFLEYVYKYIYNLKLEGNKIIESARKTGFLGFLICIKSVQFLYENYVITHDLNFLCTYKLSQDHIEYFFSSIRARGGFNNNPSARQFRTAFKQMLVHGELKHIKTGNCIPLQEIDILTYSRPEVAINKTSCRDRLIEDEDCSQGTSLFMEDHDYLSDPSRLTEYSIRVIEYIAGFIVRKLKEEIHCEDCISSIINSEKYPSLQLKKDKGGLYFPTKDVVIICQISEKIFRGRMDLHKKNLPIVLSQVCLKNCVGLSLFPNNIHFQNKSLFDNHYPFLIKAISLKYFKTRIYYAAKKMSDRTEKVRNFYNKLVLFKGQ